MLLIAFMIESSDDANTDAGGHSTASADSANVNNQFAVLTAVDGFYSRAFDRIQQLMIAMLVSIGGVVPILIAIIQRIQFKLESKVVRQKLGDGVNKLGEELAQLIDGKFKGAVVSLNAATDKANADFNCRLEDLAKKYEQQLSTTEKSLVKKIADVTGGVLHTQGIMKLQNREYGCALSSFIDAGQQHILSDNDLLLTRTVEIV